MYYSCQTWSSAQVCCWISMVHPDCFIVWLIFCLSCKAKKGIEQFGRWYTIIKRCCLRQICHNWRSTMMELTYRSTSSRATRKTNLSFPLKSWSKQSRSKADFKSAHLRGCNFYTTFVNFGPKAFPTATKCPFKSHWHEFPSPYGFLNSVKQVSEVFAADRKSSVKAPLWGANHHNWVGMLARDLPVTASQYVVARGFLTRSLLLPLHPLL